ncbi:MAG: hypothetical protein MJE68_01080, partial [Proteobacteria bacterium]|nr:hypothetical protein [Pseudomonadota bacterium]
MLKSKLQAIVFQIYMDSFYGCYEDTAHDYHHSTWQCMRFMNILMSSIFAMTIHTLYLSTAAFVFVFALTLVAKFQPYKNKRNNTIDIILLLTIITAFISSTMYYAEEFIYTKLLNGIVVAISVLIGFGYLVFLILACVFPKVIQCSKKCKTCALLLTKIKLLMSEV